MGTLSEPFIFTKPHRRSTPKQQSLEEQNVQHYKENVSSSKIQLNSVKIRGRKPTNQRHYHEAKYKAIYIRITTSLRKTRHFAAFRLFSVAIRVRVYP